MPESMISELNKVTWSKAIPSSFVVLRRNGNINVIPPHLLSTSETTLAGSKPTYLVSISGYDIDFLPSLAVPLWGFQNNSSDQQIAVVSILTLTTVVVGRHTVERCLHCPGIRCPTLAAEEWLSTYDLIFTVPANCPRFGSVQYEVLNKCFEEGQFGVTTEN